jgi:uncharacterized protein YgiM (DUF1202 family)
MKKLFFLIFIFNVVLVFSQNIDRSKYQLMTYEEAFTRYIDSKGRYSYFIMEAHFIEISYLHDYPELVIFTNDTERYYSSLWLKCNPNILNLPKSTVIRVYYQMYSDWVNTYYTVDFIEPVNKRFIIGNVYPTFENLNIRNEPSTSSSIITTIKKYDVVNILDEGPKTTIDGINSLWVKVKLKSGQIGWAFGGYLEFWNRPPDPVCK